MKYFYIAFLCLFVAACSSNNDNGNDNKSVINSNIDSQNTVINNKEPIIIDLDIKDVMTDEEVEKYYSENRENTVNYIYINDNHSPFINNNNSIIISIDKKDNISLVEPEPQTELFIDTSSPFINSDANIILNIE